MLLMVMKAVTTPAQRPAFTRKRASDEMGEGGGGQTSSGDLAIMNIAGGGQESTTALLSKGESNSSLSI